MTRRPPTRATLVLVLAGLLASVPPVAGAKPKDHPRGVWGQDELRRSIRQLENDWDRLMEAWRAWDGPKDRQAEHARASEQLAAVGAELDRLRDEYPERSQAETLEAVAELLPKEEPLFLELRLLQPPDRFRDAWGQVHLDLKRLAQEADAATGEGPGWLGRMPDPDPLKVAVAEIEDLSDELKRYLLRTDAEESDWEPQVTKGSGRARHQVHYSRLERAVLDFEEAADELKALHRKHERPRRTRDLVDRLARAARTIDFSMGEASTPAEARREWSEIVPELRVVLAAEGRRLIGAGWETHR